MHGNDQIHLRHLLDAAWKAMRVAQGRTRQDLDVDEGFELSLMKAVEMIGEAASRVGEETRRQYPAIPWVRIVAMRNRLVHVYFDINFDALWRTVQEDLPGLITQLEAIVPPQEDV